MELRKGKKSFPRRKCDKACQTYVDDNFEYHQNVIVTRCSMHADGTTFGHIEGIGKVYLVPKTTRTWRKAEAEEKRCQYCLSLMDPNSTNTVCGRCEQHADTQQF